MKRRRTVKRRGPWPLARVLQAHRLAPAVWLGLLEISAGATTVTPTREQLSAVTGIKRLASLSAALSVLVKAGWIAREVVAVQSGDAHEMTAKVLRITLRRSTTCAFGGSRRRSTTCAFGNSPDRRSTTCADGSRASTKCAFGSAIDRRSTTCARRSSTKCALTSLSEKGRPETAPDASAGAAAAQAHSGDNGHIALADVAAGVFGRVKP